MMTKQARSCWIAFLLFMMSLSVHSCSKAYINSQAIVDPEAKEIMEMPAD